MSKKIEVSCREGREADPNNAFVIIQGERLLNILADLAWAADLGIKIDITLYNSQEDVIFMEGNIQVPISKSVYGEMCRDPKLCAGKGYCPRDPACSD